MADTLGLTGQSLRPLWEPHCDLCTAAPSLVEAEEGLGLHCPWHLLSTVLTVPHVLISQMKTLMLRQPPAQGYLAGKCHSQDSNPGRIPKGPNCVAIMPDAGC